MLKRTIQITRLQNIETQSCFSCQRYKTLEFNATSLSHKQFPSYSPCCLVQRVLSLTSPGTRSCLNHISIPILAVGSGIVDFQHVCRVNLVSSDNAGGSVAAIESLVKSIPALFSGRQALLHTSISNHRQNPGTHLLTILLQVKQF